MTIDPAVIPGLLLLTAGLAALAAVGYVIVRVVLRQDDERMALAQGLVVGLALWGVITNFVLYVVPGMAGAAVGWGVVLALGALVVWRAPRPIRPSWRTVAGFAVAVLALSWAALASRQQLTVTDPFLHLGLPASLRAGVFPPEAFWNPGMPLHYHHGVDLLVGLLAPPMGPDPAFVNELLGVFGWVSFVLVVVTALVARASWPIALVLAPLLLSTGLWTWVSVGSGILQMPIPAGLPEAGLRASLGEIYWPAEWQLSEIAEVKRASLPNIWKPAFPLAYALAFVVLERAAQARGRSWPASLTLAGLIGFAGLLATSLTPLVLGLWAGLEAAHLGKVWRERALTWGAVCRPGAGLALAVVLLLASGGSFTGFLDDSASAGLVFWWDGDPRHWRLLGVIQAQPGGVALLAVGPVVVAGIAALLAWRDRLVTALAVGAVLLAVASLVLRYEPFPVNIERFAGNARNLALVALLLALSTRLAGLQPRWRRAAGVMLAGLIIWPTVVGPVRALGSALGQGVEVANAGVVGPAAVGDYGRGRAAMPAVSARVAAYIRDHTAVDARVLVPDAPSWKVTAVTGRPNSAGFAGVVNVNYKAGPEYFDAREFLEPEAVRRLGIDYVYASDAWAARLPERAARWLADPGLFELLVRDGPVALYRVRPAFLALDVTPTAASFAALRSLPPSVLVYLAPQIPPVDRLRVASALSHTRLSGHVDNWRLHLLTPAPWDVQPLGTRVPDLVVLPAGVDPWMLPSGWRPIWRNDNAAIYASPSTETPNLALPKPEPAPVGVRVTATHLDLERLTFTATFGERAPERWTSQDWLLVPLSESPVGIPEGFLRGARGPEFTKWFDGFLASGSATTTHTYRFDLPTSALEVRNDRGAFTPLPASGGELRPGTWALVIRLRHEWQPNYWREAAFVPVLRLQVADDGAIAFEVYANARGN